MPLNTIESIQGVWGWKKSQKYNLKNSFNSLLLLQYKEKDAFADFRYGEEHSFSPSTLILAATKG